LSADGKLAGGRDLAPFALRNREREKHENVLDVSIVSNSAGCARSDRWIGRERFSAGGGEVGRLTIFTRLGDT